MRKHYRFSLYLVTSTTENRNAAALQVLFLCGILGHAIPTAGNTAAPPVLIHFHIRLHLRRLSRVKATLSITGYYTGDRERFLFVFNYDIVETFISELRYHLQHIDSDLLRIVIQTGVDDAEAVRCQYLAT